MFITKNLPDIFFYSQKYTNAPPPLFFVFITKNLPDHRGPKKRKKTQLKMESEEELELEMHQFDSDEEGSQETA